MGGTPSIFTIHNLAYQGLFAADWLPRLDLNWEQFTINRLDLPSQLRRCLASTNIIESPNAGIREKTGRVTRWRDGPRVLRWTASAVVTLEKRMRRIMGHQQLWILEAKLQNHNEQQGVAKKLKSA